MGGRVRATILTAILFAAPAAQAVPLQDRCPACLSCHGESGTSMNTEVPSLGAQREPYALIQLYLFREKLRLNEVMNAMTHDFKDEDLQTYAHAISELPPPAPVTAPADAAVMDRGRGLADKYRCNFCHAADLTGRDNVPRIASQREDYLVKTLLEYKANTRHGYDGSMAEVLAPISGQEIEDVAYFVARQ
jgi:cytochrome c553